jgi:Mn2+/Fe2+ NRAMP family transporter
LGPGVIGLGIAIGSGEWLIGPAVVLKYGAALLWITSIAVFLQVILNQEMGRYTLCTGEPIFTGFMRTRPGPAFWGWTYGILSLCQYGWPGWALAACQRPTIQAR